MATSEFIIPTIFKDPLTKAVFTTRRGGVSQAPYNELNLGDHVKDDLKTVLKNREIVLKECGFKAIAWMNQTHSTKVCKVALANADSKIDADAIVTTDEGLGLAVMTADCLPVLLADEKNGVFAAVHCGWRGIYGNILTHAVNMMKENGAHKIKAALGPAIGFDSFEIGTDLKDKFLAAGAPLSAFKDISIKKTGKALCSLTELASFELNGLGLDSKDIEILPFDTFKDPEKFFSYRKNNITGRMAGIIGKLV